MDPITKNEYAEVLENYRTAMAKAIRKVSQEVIEEAMIGYLNGLQTGNSEEINIAKKFLTYYAA